MLEVEAQNALKINTHTHTHSYMYIYIYTMSTFQVGKNARQEVAERPGRDIRRIDEDGSIQRVDLTPLLFPCGCACTRRGGFRGVHVFTRTAPGEVDSEFLAAPEGVRMHVQVDIGRDGGRWAREAMEDGSMYVCGDTAAAKDVREAVLSALVEEGGERQVAVKKMQSLVKQGRSVSLSFVEPLLISCLLSTASLASGFDSGTCDLI
jgi:hypothetical protein